MGRNRKNPVTIPSSSSSSVPPSSDCKPFDYTLYKSRFLPRVPSAEASAKNETVQNHKDERKFEERKQEKQTGKEPVAFDFGYMRIDGKLYHASAPEIGPMILMPYDKHVKEQLAIAGPVGKSGMLKAMGFKDPEIMEKKREKKMKRNEKLKKKHQKEWKERLKVVDVMKVERQKKRADNIKAKIREKKMRKIEKREKKLLYPGRPARD